jgi:hypothetical protein
MDLHGAIRGQHERHLVPLFGAHLGGAHGAVLDRDVVDTLLRLVGGSSVAGAGRIGAQREEQTDEADHNQCDYH